MDMIAVVSVTLTGLVVVLLRDVVTAAQSGLALSCVFAVSSPILCRNVCYLVNFFVYRAFGFYLLIDEMCFCGHIGD
jgi:hypothetical protein